MEKTINFAIVGCGKVASKHTNAINQLQQASLTVVCDKVEEKAKKLAEDMHANNELESIYDALSSNHVIRSEYRDAYNYLLLLGQVREELYNAEKDKKRVIEGDQKQPKNNLQNSRGEVH